MAQSFYKGLTREQVIERLTAQDVRTVLRAVDEGDYQFLCDIIQGNGIVPYNNMKPDDLEGEYVTREDEIEQLIDDGEMPYDVD
jgi:hypothetical protein